MNYPETVIRDTRLTIGLASIAVLGFAYLAVTLAALHLLRTDYDPVRQFMSDYGIGEYSMLANASFAVLGVATLSLAAGLLRTVAPEARIAAALLAVAGASTFIIAIFPIDLEGEPHTASGDVHQLAHAIQIWTITATSVVMAWYAGEDDRWRAFHRLGVILAVAIVALLAVHTTVAQVWPEFKGASQRSLALPVVSWLLLMAITVMVVADRDRSSAANPRPSRTLRTESPSVEPRC